MALSVQSAGRTHGVFLSLASQPLKLSEEDFLFGQLLAQRLGTAVENSRLLRELKDAVRARDESIAALERAEEERRESEEHLRLVIANSPDMIFVQDRDLRYTWIANPAHLTEEQMLGKTDFDLLPKEEAQQLAEINRQVLETGVGTRVEVGLTLDGDKRYYEAVYQPWRDRGGRTVGIAGYRRDITERKQVERFREEYLSLISHDLRNPLTSVLGMAQWLQRTLNQQGLRREAHSAEAMVNSARRMSAMIQDLVDSTRLETGQLDMHKESTDLFTLVHDIAERVGSVEDRARIQLESPEWVPPLMADRERIERAIVNLLSNALKYSPAAAPVVVRIEQQGDQAIVAVTDRGEGIPAEDVPHLFERFYRTKAGQKAGGLGLGLYITRLIVEAHGGQVCAESEPGKGSRFYLSLPLH